MIASLLVSSVTAALLLAGSMRVNGALAWLVAAPFAMLGRDRVRWRDAAFFGAAFGLTAGTLTHAAWLTATAERYFHLQPPVAAAAALGLTLATGAAQGALLGCGVYAALRMRGAWTILAAGSTWAVWEWLQLRLFPYYPWASLALGSARLEPARSESTDALLLAAGSIVGAGGVSLCLSAFGLALGVAGLGSSRLTRRSAGILAVAVVVLLVGLGWIARRERRTEDAKCEVEVVDVSASDSSALETATRTAATRWSGAPAAVVWPESALERSPELDHDLRARLQTLAADLDTVVIAGGTRVSWSGSWSERRFNSAFRIDGGSALRSYDKRRVVPFTEYWPWPWIAPPAPFEVAAIGPGDTATLFDAGGCRLAPMICFEAESPALAREAARSGADAIVILSNDVPLPPTAVALEIAQARWRAVETGLAVIRAANGGRSLMALPRGNYERSPRLRVPPAEPAPALWISPVIEGVALVVAAIAVVVAATSDVRSWSR